MNAAVRAVCAVVHSKLVQLSYQWLLLLAVSTAAVRHTGTIELSVVAAAAGTAESFTAAGDEGAEPFCQHETSH